MKIRLIRLIQNELIKIFKRKSIYLLFFIALLVIIIYNFINPEQNEKVFLGYYNTEDIKNIENMEDNLNNMTERKEEYIMQKSSIDIYKLYNNFEKNTWQRFALREEIEQHALTDTYSDYNKDLLKYIKNINTYEINKSSEITNEIYEISKIKYNEYVNIFKTNNWKEYVKQKIKNLSEIRDSIPLTEKQKKEINIEIEYYELRINNNINFDNNILNTYLRQYREYSYISEIYNLYTSESQILNRNIAKKEICKYAIENNIVQDISNETNLILNNTIDARISFIRTFKNFDLIIVVIAIYISTTIITEEINKRTIKKLLIKPHTRIKILFSKVIAAIIVIIISMIFVVSAQYIIGGLLFGFESYNLEYIGYDYYNETVLRISLFKYILIIGISKLPMYIMIIAFCVFIGTANKHTSMSMILTLIIFLISNTIIKEWSRVDSISILTRYFITNNWDFSVYLWGQKAEVSGINIGSSILIYVLHLTFLLCLSLRIFNRKEINNV